MDFSDSVLHVCRGVYFASTFFGQGTTVCIHSVDTFCWHFLMARSVCPFLVFFKSRGLDHHPRTNVHRPRRRGAVVAGKCVTITIGLYIGEEVDRMVPLPRCPLFKILNYTSTHSVHSSQQYATLDMVVAEGEQLLRLGDYLRWVKEAKALLQQCNHGKEDGKEEGAQRPSVEAAYALVVHCETVLKKTNEGDSLEKDTLQRLLTNAQQATEAVDAHLRDLNVDDKGESLFFCFLFFVCFCWPYL